MTPLIKPDLGPDLGAKVGPKVGPGKAVLQRLLQLDQPIPVRTDLEIEAEVERNYRWNFTVNLLDGTAFWFGFHVISSSTIVPLYISKLTLNPFVIGLVAVVAQAGWYLPQLLTAGQVERLARKKPVAVNLGLFLERLPMWILPVAALISLQSPVLALILFFIGYTWFHLGAGMIAPAWQDLIARCFPVTRRGRFFGLTSFIGTGVGTLGAGVAGWLLEARSFPLNFFYIFIIAAASIAFSWVFLALTREPVQPVPPLPANQQRYWTKWSQIVRRDDNYRRYLLARLLMTMGTMGIGFLTVAAVQRWDIADSTVGLYTAALLLGEAGGNLLLGLLADRYGHKLSLEIGLTAGAVAFALAWLAPAPGWYYAAFLFLGMAIGATIVSGILITMEFSAPAQRPTYIGIANTIIGLGSIIAPLIGSWLAGFSYTGLFAVSAVLNVLAWGYLHWGVKEPRWQSIRSVEGQA
jgi:MFS family permease